MQFEDIIGQEKIIEHLRAMIASERVPHAQLYTGKDGYGALAMALAFVQELLLKSASDKKAATIKCEHLVHPDVHFVFPVNRSEGVKGTPTSKDYIEQWRAEVLKNPYLNYQHWLECMEIGNKQAMINVEEAHHIITTLSLRPYESEFKVLIIWHADKMNTAAANKLLKIIEEPPQKTLFILTSESTENMLPTILSRTQITRFGPLSQGAISQALKAKFDLNDEQVANLAHLSEGDYQRALDLVNKDEFMMHLSEHFKHWMRSCFKKDVAGLIEFADASSKMSREAQKSLLLFGMRIFRESIAFNYAGEHLMYSGSDLGNWVKNFAAFVNHKTCMYFEKEFNDALYHLERNANPRILWFDLSIKCMQLFRLAKQNES